MSKVMDNQMKVSSKNFTILLVDDESTNLDILSNVLVDYKKKVAINGNIAIKLAKSKPIPDLIVLDIIMPKIDGYQVCKELKSNSLTKDIPIIFISAMTEIKDLVKGFEVGGVDYITKPFNSEEVLKRVDTHLTLNDYRKKLENTNVTLEEKVRERTTELEITKNKAEESSRLKSHFLSLLSHELRTPMVGIMGISEIFCKELEGELGKFALNLLDSSRRLNETLGSILDLSRLESNKQTINIVEFDLTKRVKQLMISHQMNAKIKGLELKISFKGIPEFTQLDIVKFDIIFNNIISNAIKYTEIGSVEVTVESRLENGIRNNIFTVKDSGIGIPKEKHSIIFEEFRQVDEGMRRNYEGVGLGLSIVKMYVVALKGTIEFESELDKGTKFIVTLPCYSSFENYAFTKLTDKKIEAPKPIDKKIKLLIVEDDLSNIQVSKIFLSDICEVFVATNGNDALIMAHKNNFDCFLMDINLGRGISGVDVTKTLRKTDKYLSTPIISYTAYALEGDEENFLEVGCSHYISKPADKKTIREVILNSTR